MVRMEGKVQCVCVEEMVQHCLTCPTSEAEAYESSVKIP